MTSPILWAIEGDGRTSDAWTVPSHPLDCRDAVLHGLAALVVVPLVPIKLLSDSLIGHGPPLILFLLFLSPLTPLPHQSPDGAFRLVVFLIEGGLISALMEPRRAPRRRAEEGQAR